MYKCIHKVLKAINILCKIIILDCFSVIERSNLISILMRLMIISIPGKNNIQHSKNENFMYRNHLCDSYEHVPL